MVLSIANPKNSSYVNKIVQAANSVLGSATTTFNKLSTKKPVDVVSENPEMMKLRQEQSARIQVRLYVTKKQFGDLIRYAESARTQDVVWVAIHEIRGLEDGDAAVELLEDLARGNSWAAIPALEGLVMKDEKELARAILFERLQLDHIPALIAEGKAKLSDVLSLLGQLSEDSNWSAYYFPLLWQSLSLDPKKQMCALAEILGDPEPEGCRFLHAPTHVAQCVKADSVRMLAHIPDPIRERGFWYATRDGDDEIAGAATRWLMNHWQTDGVVPPGLEFFPMADIRLLYYLVQLGGNFRWQDGVSAGALYEELVKEDRALETMDEGCPHAQARYERVEELRHQLLQISERRICELQPLVNQITALLSLPYAQLNLIDRADNSVASYVMGEGQVNFQRWVLFEDEPMSEEVMSALLHELGHMAQDVLIIRMIADDLRLVFGKHSEKIMPLWERYTECLGYAPDHMFLLAVLRLRNDQHLTQNERQRAMHIAKDAKNAKLFNDYQKAIGERLDQLAESSQQLLSGDYDRQLLACLRDMKSVQSLFNSNCVPEVLLFELTRCREELDAVVRVALANGQCGTGVKLRDTVALAEQLFDTEFGHPVRQVAEHVRNVVYQTIEEEAKHLRKSRWEFARAGYQEAECYVISDRVEVVVKALKKGWY